MSLHNLLHRPKLFGMNNLLCIAMSPLSLGSLIWRNNVFVKEDEGETIDCTAWLGVLINGTIEVGGDVNCISKVELGTN